MESTQDTTSIHSQNEVTVTSNIYQYDRKQISTFNDEEKSISVSSTVDQQEICEEPYPGLVELTPFPTLGSIDEITHTLTRTRTNRTFKNQQRDRSSLKTAIVTGDQQKEEKVVVNMTDEYYGTEGYRNPGWMPVMATFLVNFFVKYHNNFFQFL